jgi:probable HAF family extracellular repeat protein
MLAAGAQWTNPHWSVVELGSAGGNHSVVYGVSSQGKVGSARDNNGDDHASWWRLYGGVEEPIVPVLLQGMGGHNSYVYHINDLGSLVGKAQGTSGLYHAVYWRAGEGAGVFEATDLGTLGGLESEARAVNNNINTVKIVGSSKTAKGFWRGTLWQRGAGSVTFVAIPLDTLGGKESFAYSINELGLIVGAADTAFGLRHACVWKYVNAQKRYIAIDLDKDGLESQARDINNRREVVGSYKLSDGTVHAFKTIYTNTLAPQAIVPANDLHTLGGRNSWASAISDKMPAEVVGWSEADIGDPEPRAFYYPVGSGTAVTMVALNDHLVIAAAGWKLTHAHDIGSQSEIAASGFTKKGKPRGASVTFHDENGMEPGQTAGIGAMSTVPTVPQAQTVSGTVSRSGTASEMVVTMTSSDETVVKVEEPTVTIHQGENSATYHITGVATGNADIVASGGGTTLSNTVTVSGHGAISVVRSAKESGAKSVVRRPSNKKTGL